MTNEATTILTLTAPGTIDSEGQRQERRVAFRRWHGDSLRKSLKLKLILNRLLLGAVALAPAVVSFSPVGRPEASVVSANPVETTDPPEFSELVEVALNRMFLRVIDCWGLPYPLGPFYTPKQTKFLRALAAIREANEQGKVREGEIVNPDGTDGATGQTSSEREDENGNPVSTAAVGAGDEVVTIDPNGANAVPDDDILPSAGQRSLAGDYQTFQATLVHEGARLLQEFSEAVPSDMPEAGNPEALGEKGTRIKNDPQALCAGQDAWALDRTHWDLVLCLGVLDSEYFAGDRATDGKLLKLGRTKRSAESQLQQAISEGK